MSAADFFLLYEAYAASRRSWCKERYHFSYFLSVLGDVSLSDITTRHIDSWRAARRLAISDSSVDREFNSLCAFFQKAVEWGYLAENPCARLKRFGGGVRRFRTLEQDEAHILLDAARGSGPLVYFIFRTLHDTGMRPGELRAMYWTHVDTSDRAFRLRRTKTGVGRVVYPSNAVWAALCDLPRPTDLVIFAWPRSKIEAVCSTVHNFSLYDFRKNFITRALRAGVDISTVAAAAGCSPQTILKFYAGTDPHLVKECFDRATLYERSGVQLKLVHE